MSEEQEAHGPKPLTTAPIAAPRATRGVRCLFDLKIFLFLFLSKDTASRGSAHNLTMVSQKLTFLFFPTTARAVENGKLVVQSVLNVFCLFFFSKETKLYTRI